MQKYELATQTQELAVQILTTCVKNTDTWPYCTKVYKNLRYPHTDTHAHIHAHLPHNMHVPRPHPYLPRVFAPVCQSRHVRAQRRDRRADLQLHVAPGRVGRTTLSRRRDHVPRRPHWRAVPRLVPTPLRRCGQCRRRAAVRMLCERRVCGDASPTCCAPALGNSWRCADSRPRHAQCTSRCVPRRQLSAGPAA